MLLSCLFNLSISDCFFFIFNMSTHVNILVLGHSFTRRLQKWCVDNHLANMNLDPNRFQVYWHGISGGTIMHPARPKSLWSEMDVACNLGADIVFLDIGSNDLCDRHTSAEALFQQLLAFARALISSSCRTVVFSQILHRQGSSDYNSRVDSTNSLLREACDGDSNLIFWSHSRNNYSRRFLSDYVATDGVHVDNIRGMPRYYSSVRGALIFAANKL